MAKKSDKIIAIADDIVSFYKKFFEEQGKTKPAAFLVLDEKDDKGRNSVIHIDLSDYMNNSMKPMIKQLINMSVNAVKTQGHEVVAILFCAEVYMLKSVGTEEELADELKKCGGSLANHPDKIEGIMFTLETKENTKIKRIPIRGAKKLGRASKWEQHNDAKGTLGNFMDKPKDVPGYA